MLTKSILTAAAAAALAAVAWTPVAQGAPFDTFVVNDEATPDDCGSLEADFSVIQDAIDAASDTTKAKKRDVILVCPGTYFENVVVDKTVILQGVGGAAVGYAIVDAAGITMRIDADGVKIDNLMIVNGTTSGNVILVGSDGNEISHNWIVGAREGILIAGQSVGNSVHHNMIEDTYDDGIDVAGSGNDIHHNTISGTGASGEGIELGYNAGDNVVHHNTLTMIGDVGIEVKSDFNDIHHNTITDSGVGEYCSNGYDCAGIHLTSRADDNNVHDNIVTGSDDNGIESSGDRNDINMNFSCDNGGNDIDILAGADNRVLGNTATFIVDGGTGTVVMNNSPCPD